MDGAPVDNAGMQPLVCFRVPRHDDPTAPQHSGQLRRRAHRTVARLAPARRSTVAPLAVSRLAAPRRTMVPLLIPVDDVPLEPDRAALANLVELHATVAESEDIEPAELHLAMLLE